MFFEETPQIAHGHQRGLHIQQFLRVQHAAVRGQVDLGADVMCAADLQVGGCDQAARLAGFRQAGGGFFEVRSGRKQARKVSRAGEVTQVCQARQDLGVFEHTKSFGVHDNQLYGNKNTKAILPGYSVRVLKIQPRTKKTTIQVALEDGLVNLRRVYWKEASAVSRSVWISNILLNPTISRMCATSGVGESSLTCSCSPLSRSRSIAW